MATSRRTRGSKPVLTRARTAPKTAEGASYTVETRRQAPKQRPQTEEPGPQDGLAGILAALKGAGQVGIYRLQPTWARGHLQTLNLGAGEELDFSMLDQLGRFWGGGVYQFRPMNRGRFAGATQSVQFDGPTLFNGKPHPKDPSIAEAVTPEVMHPHPHQYQGQGYAPPQYGGGYEPQHYGAPPAYGQPPGAMSRPSPELAMLGGLMDRVLNRMDSLEAKLAGPGAAPSQAPDQIAGVLQTLKLAQQIREMMNPADDYDDDDDDDDEPDAWTPKNPQEAMMQLALKKFEADPDALDKLLGDKKPKPAAAPQQQRPAGAGPRLVRAGEQTPPAAAAPAGGLSPGQIVAQLQQLDPQARAELVNEIGKSLDPETLAQMMQMIGGGSAAG